MSKEELIRENGNLRAMLEAQLRQIEALKQHMGIVKASISKMSKMASIKELQASLKARGYK
jgi:hypothetical protein